MPNRDTRPSGGPGAGSDLVEAPHEDPRSVRSESRVSGPGRGPETTPQVLRTLEVRLDLLRARGIPVPEMDLPGAYGKRIVAGALMLTLSPEDEKGYDARDSAGIRYRIVGQRMGGSSGEVIVPGIPERSFDRLVSVVFGAGFGVEEARMVRTEPFLRKAEYREESNEWSLPVDDDFWSGSEVDDLTVVLRTEAAQEGRHQQMPVIESISTPRPYPSTGRREGGIKQPEA